MTKQGVVVPAPAEAAVVVPPNAAAPLFPPPRNKCLQMGGAGATTAAARVGGWVESMRASSPTHARAAAALAAGVDEERHAAWMVEHPSALSKFDQVVAASKGKQIVVFLDYDGTLSPIVDDPDAAYMSDTMRRAVRSVAKHFPTAIVSGRCRDKVRVRVREAGGALLRREPRHGHQGPRESVPPHQGRQGQGRSLSTRQRVPAHDRAGGEDPGGKNQGHSRRQGGEQQVLRLRPLQARRREILERAGGHGEVGAQGLPEAEADAGADGVRGPAHHQVGQGESPRVPARVAGLRRLRRRAAGVHRRRPHRRGRLQGAPQARQWRRHPRLQAPQGHLRILLAAGARRGDGVPSAARRVGAPLQGATQVVIHRRRRPPAPIAREIDCQSARARPLQPDD